MCGMCCNAMQNWAAMYCSTVPCGAPPPPDPRARGLAAPGAHQGVPPTTCLCCGTRAGAAANPRGATAATPLPCKAAAPRLALSRLSLRLVLLPLLPPPDYFVGRGHYYDGDGDYYDYDGHYG